MSSEKPWRDEETLRELFVDEGMTRIEIGEELGCHRKVAGRWISKYGIERYRPWRDEEILRRLYHDEGLSQHEIADKFDISQSCVYHQMKKNGIESNVPKRDRVPNFMTHQGYERWQTTVDYTPLSLLHHRLLAVAKYGFDVVVENQVHHRNGIPWDNRPDNLELLSIEEHGRLHANEYWATQ